jgi:imidazolonepropionase-like amidohydrolase
VNPDESENCVSETFVLIDALLFDGVASELSEGVSVVVADGHIREVHTDGAVPSVEGTRIPCHGRTILPGLIDAHVHIGAVEVYFENQARQHPASLIAFKMAQRLRHLLNRGYTTVRDCGGADWGFKQALEQGLIAGPRVIISNRMLSQTGGHGDMRTRGETGHDHHSCNGFGMVFSVADGVSEVRRAVREQIRMGADFIKVMASGGAASPTDKIDRAQYSEEELRIIVEEAEMAGAYVAAHALPAVAITRAVAAGARTVEHGNFLDDESAALMAERGTYLVPTVATYVMADRHSERYDYTPEIAEKVSSAAKGALHSLEIADRHGVLIGSGSDLLGEEISWLNHELELKADVLGAASTLRAATSVNAELIGRDDIGVVEPGRRADLIVVDGNPLENVGVLGRPAGPDLVMQDGRIHRTTLV